MLPKNEEEYSKGKIIYKNIYRKAVELGGTVSAEHGIGKLKTEYLLDMYVEKVMSKMAGIKKTLDPNLILGIGNIFDESEGEDYEELGKLLKPVVEQLFKDAKVKWKRTNSKGYGYSIAEDSIQEFLNWDLMPWE